MPKVVKVVLQTHSLIIKLTLDCVLYQMSTRDRKTAVKEVKDWLSRLHCLVVGPGMGRNPTIIENVKVNLI